MPILEYALRHDDKVEAGTVPTTFFSKLNKTLKPISKKQQVKQADSWLPTPIKSFVDDIEKSISSDKKMPAKQESIQKKDSRS